MPLSSNKYLLTCLFFLLIFPASAQKSLSEKSQISILTGSPSDADLFSLFGHSSLRVCDSELDIDYVFSYGIFNGSKLENMASLIQGNFTCDIWAVPFDDDRQNNILKRASVTELVLNLSGDEKESLWQSLLAVAQNQNQTIRYDLFKKNCTALPLNLVEENVKGTIIYKNYPSTDTYLSSIKECLGNHPWVQFYIDISVGTNGNKPITYQQKFFVPHVLHEAFLSAEILNDDGTTRELVSQSPVILETDTKPSGAGFFTPFVCSMLLLLLIIAASIAERKRKTHYRIVDILLFTLFGLVGVYLFLLSIVYHQWYSFPNWWIIWLHPLHLVGVVFTGFKYFVKYVFYYHIFNIFTVGFMLVGLLFIPQHYNIAFFPLAACLAIRSAVSIIENGKLKVKNECSQS